MTTEQQNKKQLPAVRQHVGPIAPIVPADIDQLQRMANMMAASGFFQDARDMAQACVKIAAGAEYGLPPVVAMTGINVIKGRVTLSANTMAAIMKRAGYKLKTRFDGDHLCVITVTDPEGEELGLSSFSMDDAKRAGLGGDNWRKYPRNMLFARAVSNAARWYAPEVLTGAITPEELGEVEEPPVIEVVEAEVVSETQQFRNELAALADTTSGREVMRIAEEGKHSPAWTNLNKKIHAKLKEVGLTHNSLKQLLPDGYEIKKASEDQLDALSSLLFAPDLDSLKVVWKIVAGAYPNLFDGVKDHMKQVLGGA